MIVVTSLSYHFFQGRHVIDHHPDFEEWTIFNSNELHTFRNSHLIIPSFVMGVQNEYPHDRTLYFYVKYQHGLYQLDAFRHLSPNPPGCRTSL